jgi:hypothetical protein
MSTTLDYDMKRARELLELSFPIGMFGDEGGTGAGNALRALRIIEGIIGEATVQNAQYARFALLQSFPRFIEHEGLTKNEIDAVRAASKDFVRKYSSALSPAWYAELFPALNGDEIEVYLKNYLFAHEMWGHPQGVAAMVKSMLESSLHDDVIVNVYPLAGEERGIPEELHSRLGRKENFSYLGKNFMIGRRVDARPESYEIAIGPITTTQLEVLQRAGWADGTRVTEKLARLVEFTEPFYLRGRLRFLFERVGFVLGTASVGRGRLGLIGQAQDWV